MSDLVHFCDREEAESIVEAFATKFSLGFNRHSDFYGRNIDAEGGDPRREYILGMKASALEFSREETSALEGPSIEAVEFIRTRFPELRMDTPVRYVKFREGFEGGAFHLVGNGVAFSDRVISSVAKALMEHSRLEANCQKLIAHELFHVVDALNPGLLAAIAPYLGFLEPSPVRLGEGIAMRVFSNPDLTEHYPTLIDDEGTERLVLPLYWYKGDMVPTSLGEVFRKGQIETKIVRVEKEGDVLVPSNDGRGEPFVEGKETMMERVGGLPVYSLVLPEITAELLGIHFSGVEKGFRDQMALTDESAPLVAGFMDVVTGYTPGPALD
ncbi:MAG: hypothetical protein ACYTFG_04955 [Planctomycetota bacterium]|jgi:hypothetical protein